MVMRIWAGLGAAVVLGSAAAVLAQAEPPVPSEPFRMVQVVAWESDPMDSLAQSPDMIRRAQIIGDFTGWLSEADAPIAAWRATAQAGSVHLKLDVDPQGRVSKCTAQGVSSSNPEPLAWGNALCPFVRDRARFAPALRSDGAAMGDQIDFLARFLTSYSHGPRSGPLIQFYPPVPVMVMSAPTSTELKQWPPSADWLNAVARQPGFSGSVEQPGGAPLQGTVIGLVVADPKSGDPECRVIRSSGKPRLDAKACDHVLKKLKPKWDDGVRFPVRRWPLLLAPKGKGFRVVTANDLAQRAAQLETGEQARLEGLWRGQVKATRFVSVRGYLSPQGSALICRISRSSGNDAADVAACRLFMAEARIAPARDIFGQQATPANPIYLDFTPQ